MSGQKSTHKRKLDELFVKMAKLRDEIHKESLRLIEGGQTAASEKLRRVDNQSFEIVSAIHEASEELF